jgi:hypothetical protein
MGMRQSKQDVYTVMCKNIHNEACALATFSTLAKALAHVPKVCYSGPMWIEKFRVDSPGFYETDDEYIVWRSSKSVVCT